MERLRKEEKHLHDLVLYGKKFINLRNLSNKIYKWAVSVASTVVCLISVV